MYGDKESPCIILQVRVIGYKLSYHDQFYTEQELQYPFNVIINFAHIQL